MPFGRHEKEIFSLTPPQQDVLAVIGLMNGRPTSQREIHVPECLNDHPMRLSLLSHIRDWPCAGSVRRLLLQRRARSMLYECFGILPKDSLKGMRFTSATFPDPNLYEARESGVRCVVVDKRRISRTWGLKPVFAFFFLGDDDLDGMFLPHCAIYQDCIIVQFYQRAPSVDVVIGIVAPWGMFSFHNFFCFPVQVRHEVFQWLLIAKRHHVPRDVRNLICEWICATPSPVTARSGNKLL